MTSLLDKSAVAPGPVAGPAHGKARKELAAASIGGVVEGFDWMIYAVMAPYFAIQIFPGDSPVAKLLAAYVGFAVGFIARPLGSVLIGRWADRRGRRSALVLSMVTIAAANLVIALTPTAAAIGVWAAVIVVLARLVMGISFGGEIPSASAYVTETAPPKRRFLYSSIASLGGVIGPILAFITLAILLGSSGSDGVTNGGWRIAFVVAAVAGIVALWIRRGVEESHEFQAQKQDKPPAWPLLKANMRLVVATFFACVGGTVAFYLGSVYLPIYASTYGVIEQAAAEKMMPGALLAMMVALIVAGRLADRFGAFTVFRAGFLLLALGTGPLLLLLTKGVLSYFATAVIYLAIFALVLAQSNVIFSQLFPTSIRAIGYGLPYTVSAAIFGGTTPLVAQSFVGAGRPGWVLWYASATALVSFLATLFIKRSDIKIPR
jgi:MHS family alpha-ketoglutarate permease-like MFS transporter